MRIPPARKLERWPRGEYKPLAAYAEPHCALCESPAVWVYADEHLPGNPGGLCAQHDDVVLKLMDQGAQMLALKWEILPPMGDDLRDQHVLFLIAGGLLLGRGTPLVEKSL